MLQNKSGELAADTRVCQTLLSFPNPPATTYFSESSESCSMCTVQGDNCIWWDRWGGVCLLHFTGTGTKGRVSTGGEEREGQSCWNPSTRAKAQRWEHRIWGQE